MTEVENKLRHKIKICPVQDRNNSIEVTALFDTGSPRSIINGVTADRLKKIGVGFTEFNTEFTTADKTLRSKVSGAALVDFIIGDCRITENSPAAILVVKNLFDEAIFGLADMQLYGVQPIVANGQIEIPDCPPEFGIGSSYVPKKRMV